MKARLKFASGEVINGTLDVGHVSTGYLYIFTNDNEYLEHDDDDFSSNHGFGEHRFPTREAALADFKRFGEILEEQS